MTDLELDLRCGLPDALRVLLAEYPRDAWAEHRNFDGLVRFWLDRHMMFRRLMELMEADLARLLDSDMDPQLWAARLSRLGGQFVGELHGHHQIEDAHYFPVLAARDARLGRGFDILDADHHALDGILNRFTEAANGALTVWQDRPALQTAAGRLRDDLALTQRLIDRHLIDEEELVVPVILRHGAAGLG